MITFSGLNVYKQSIERFSFKSNDFDNIQTAFDTIWHVSNATASYFEEMSFQKSILTETIACSSHNTDFLWLLNSSCTQLIRLAKTSMKSYDLKLEDYNRDNDGDVLICATDVNVYLFCKKSFKCVYQLEKQAINNIINESSVMAISLNKKFSSNERIKKVSCGKEHVLILTEPSGLVYSFGIGTRGQLGHGSIESCYEPKLIENFKNVKDIECGGWHSSLIDENDYVYMWGWNLNGQLGLEEDDDEEDETIFSVPRLVQIFDDDNEELIKFKKISNGSRHSLLLDLNANVYSVGWNKYKQLLLNCNDKNDRRIPVLVEEFKKRVLDIKAGPWYSLVLTER